MIAYNKYIVANRLEEIIKTFNYFPTPEMIAQLNQELETCGKPAANDLELYMKAKSEDFITGLRELIAKKTREENANEAEKPDSMKQGKEVEPEYIKEPGTLLARSVSAKNWPKIGIGKSINGGRGVFCFGSSKN